MSALLITVGRFREDGADALGQYVAGVVPLINAAGGEIVTRGRLRQTVVGEARNQPDLVAVMRFPGAEAIRSFLGSDAYRSHDGVRDRAFEDVRSYIADDLMTNAAETSRVATPARLQNGDVFPELFVDLVGGRRIALPRDLGGSYAVVLFYRGSWCPYCCAQLAAFSRASERLAEAGITIVALSVDDRAASEALVDKLRLTFSVGFGASARAVAAATGAYLAEGAAHLQSTGFVLDRQGRVLTAVYSSGAIGRLVPDDVLGFVKYVDAHDAARSVTAMPER
jgi:peroxiredoxin/uncharacterized protein (DUF1330 family)